MAQIWFAHYAKEYLSDMKVRCLTYEQRGILQTLWSFAWEEGSIPAEAEVLAIMLGLKTREVCKHQTWIKMFFVEKPNESHRLISPRLELARSEADKKGAKARESALFRWERQREVDANAYASAMQTEMRLECDRVCEPAANDMQVTVTATDTKDRMIIPTQASGEIQDLIPTGGRTPGRKRGTRTQELGVYPTEMNEAITLWRELRRFAVEKKGRFSKEQWKYIASGIGSKEAIHRAWATRVGSKACGAVLTQQDVLAALSLFVSEKRQDLTDEDNPRLAIPMLTTVLNSDLFSDALVAIKETPDAG